MPTFMIEEQLTQYYVVKADTEEKAIEQLYDGSIDPVKAKYSDDVIVKQIEEQ